MVGAGAGSACESIGGGTMGSLWREWRDGWRENRGGCLLGIFFFVWVSAAIVGFFWCASHPSPPHTPGM